MQSSSGAKRTTETLARIAQINERRALAQVAATQRILDRQAELREELTEAHRCEEDGVLNGSGPVDAGLIQLVNGARLTHSRRMDALDVAMGETKTLLSAHRNAHDIAIHRERSASKVAERVQGARVQVLRQKQQKLDDDVTTMRYGREFIALGNH